MRRQYSEVQTYVDKETIRTRPPCETGSHVTDDVIPRPEEAHRLHKICYYAKKNGTGYSMTKRPLLHVFIGVLLVLLQKLIFIVICDVCYLSFILA